MWTWDLIDYEGDASRRTWLEEVAGISDAVFLNEVGRERMWAKTTNGTVHYVNDGTVFIGSAGAGRRPLDGKEWIPSHGGRFSSFFLSVCLSVCLVLALFII